MRSRTTVVGARESLPSRKASPTSTRAPFSTTPAWQSWSTAASRPYRSPHRRVAIHLKHHERIAAASATPEGKGAPADTARPQALDPPRLQPLPAPPASQTITPKRTSSSLRRPSALNCLPFLGQGNRSPRDGRLFHDDLQQIGEGAGLRPLRPRARIFALRIPRADGVRQRFLPAGRGGGLSPSGFRGPRAPPRASLPTRTRGRGSDARRARKGPMASGKRGRGPPASGFRKISR